MHSRSARLVPGSGVSHANAVALCPAPRYSAGLMVTGRASDNSGAAAVRHTGRWTTL